MQRIPTLLLSGLLAGGVVQAARAADAMSATDRRFVATVSQGGMFEVQAGTAAADQGSTQVIKDQGNTEAHDHKLVGDKLNAIVSDAGITLPGSLNASFQKQLDDLKALSGTRFDSTYLKEMEAVHAKDGAAFAAEARNGTNPKLRAFAAETHKIVESHIGELRATAAAQ